MDTATGGLCEIDAAVDEDAELGFNVWAFSGVDAEDASLVLMMGFD